MQRGHLNGSYIMPELCEVGYSATLARAQGHIFKGTYSRVICIGVRCSQWRALSARSSGRQIRNPVPILLQMCFLLLFITFQVRIVHQRPLYPESDHEATDPKASLRATHVPVLQCPTATVINSFEPCIPTHQFVHQMLIFCGFCSLPSQFQIPCSEFVQRHYSVHKDEWFCL